MGTKSTEDDGTTRVGGSQEDEATRDEIQDEDEDSTRSRCLRGTIS